MSPSSPPAPTAKRRGGRIRGVWARSIQNACARLNAERFEALYPHPWLVTGWQTERQMYSATRGVDLPEALAVNCVAESLRCNVERLELFPLPVSGDEVRFSIGRASANDVGLPHSSVSKRHARLHFHHGVWTLTDLASTNGTWADSRPVPDRGGSVVLRGRSELCFGSVPCILLLRSRLLYTALTLP